MKVSAFVVLAGAASLLIAQAPLKQFEVVSVKPQDPATSQNGGMRMAGGGKGEWKAINLPLTQLVMNAFHVNSNQIIANDAWMNNVGWDVIGKYPSGSAPQDVPEMLQAMLADRFRLKAHRETRTLPIYTLSVAKNGLRLKAPADPSAAGGMSAGPRRIKYSSGSMAELSGQLGSYLGKQVIDQTGLTGPYEIDLHFAPVEQDVNPNSNETAPSIFTALQEQAGLRLEATKGPVEVLVIDHADKPSAN